MTDVTLLVTAGRGPAECRDAVRGVVEALVAAAEAAGLSVGSGLGAEARPASVVVSVGGENPGGFVRGWVGTVLWVDATARGRGGRKNWYVAVHALDLAPAATVIDPADLRFQAMRAGGPGGQHQNTTDSAVRVVHLPTGLTAMARDGRSQHRNRELAVRRLQALAGVRDALYADASRRREWIDRIAVERGNPVRTFRDGREILR